MQVFSKEDIYMPFLKIGEDTGCWWNILKKGYVAYEYPYLTTFYRVGNKSLSSNKIKAIQGTWILYKKQNLIIVQRLYYYIFYLFNAVKRRI
jgi:teichuronic acid biosynthesis glycosyltransferase TuaG